MSQSIVIEDKNTSIIVVQSATPLITIIEKPKETIIVSSSGIQGRAGDIGLSGQDEINGQDGQDGVNGQDANIQVGTVSTGAEATNAEITNVGTPSNAIFNFVIPRGNTGAAGLDGQDGVNGIDGQDGLNGQGFPSGGNTNQALTKNSSTDYDTSWQSVNLAFVGAFQKNIQIDFGNTPDDNIELTITDLNVVSNSKIFVTPSGESTLDHDAEDYFLEKISAYATNIVNGAFDLIVSANDSFGKYKFNVLITN